MQILHWLFKITQGRKSEESDTSLCNEQRNLNKNADHRKHLAWFENCDTRQKRRSDSKILEIFRRRDIAKVYFFSTVNLKRVKSFNRRQHWMQSLRMKKEDFARGLGIGPKADSSAHGSNKVLPISEQAQAPSSSLANSASSQCDSLEKKEGVKGDKTKTLSRMKELLRWAAAAKAEKGGRYIGRKVMYFRNRGKLKAIPDDDQFSNDSPKISFRWDVESCSTTTSSAFSAISVASSAINDRLLHKPSMESKQTLNWITTDSEFVVLEL